MGMVLQRIERWALMCWAYNLKKLSEESLEACIYSMMQEGERLDCLLPQLQLMMLGCLRPQLQLLMGFPRRLECLRLPRLRRCIWRRRHRHGRREYNRSPRSAYPLLSRLHGDAKRTVASSQHTWACRTRPRRHRWGNRQRARRVLEPLLAPAPCSLWTVQRWLGRCCA